MLVPYPKTALTRRIPLLGLILIDTLLGGQVRAGIVENCAPSFEDHFDGSSLAPHWQISLGDGCDQKLCGWGNNEKQHYDRSQLRVADGQLIIEMAQRAGQVVSGKITTEGTFDQQFGRFEARLSLPDARGSWPAFWLLPASEKPWPLTGEIDILVEDPPPPRHCLEDMTIVAPTFE